MEAKRDPFMWQLNMNLNLNILGVVQAPFSASFSSQASKLNTPQPFNNFGISPNYKAVTLHLGYRSINLSEFSLSGSQFLGVGVEVKPKDSFIKGKALWGRFAKPVYFNPDGTIATQQSYARYGWGTGITLGKTTKKEVSFRIFKAKDDPSSLDTINPADIDMKPADNLVFGASAKYQISKKIGFEVNGDISFFTNDITIPQDIDQGYSYANNIFLFGYNGTSEYKKAFSSTLSYKPDFAKFNIEYRRVDPGYKTLGISFINNDYEDIKLKSSFSLFNKKTGVSISGGVQRNNLEKDKASKMLRVISSVGINHKINEKWNGSVNFANFNSSTRQTIVITFDSLKFVQTTKSGGLTLIRTSSTQKNNTTISFALNFQDAIVNEVRTTTFYNGNLGFQKQFSELKLSTGAALNTIHTVTEIGNTSNLGPSVMLGTSVFKDKLMLNLIGTYLSSFIDLKGAGSVMNLTFTANYTLFKKHKFSFNLSNLSKNIDGVDNTSEVTGAFNYSFSF